jgi:hypothetical protein
VTPAIPGGSSAPGGAAGPGNPGGQRSPAEHAVELPCPPAEAMRAVVSAAEDWGAELEPQGVAGGPPAAPAGFGGPGGPSGPGGCLRLPVVAGLRRGWITGPLAVEAAGQGSRVTFRPATQDYYLETSAVAVLLMAGAGALLTVAWPLFPGLLPGAPFGAVLAVAGWLLIASRPRARGPAEFLASVARHPAGPRQDDGTGNSATPGGGI